MKVIEITNVDFSLRHFLLPLMRGLRERGHEVVGACADGDELIPVRAEGFRVVAVPMARTLSPLAQWRAFRALIVFFRAEKPDLVHAHMPISGFLARLAARIVGVPRIAYTSHGFLFNQPGSWLRRAGSFAMEWIGGRVTDVFMTVSTEEASDARRLWIKRAAVPVGNGRDPARFRPDGAARGRIRAALGVPDDRVVIVIVARLVRHKGHLDLAAAMRAVPGADLWVVGERLPTDRGEDIGALLAEAGLGGRLRLLGSREDVADVLAASDIFTLPSHFEGLPMSVIEAMLTGLPVVGTRVRGIREQVVGGVTGLLVPPGDPVLLGAALGRLVEDGALRRAMGEAGRVRAAELYDEAKVVARVLDLLAA